MYRPALLFIENVFIYDVEKYLVMIIDKFKVDVFFPMFTESDCTTTPTLSWTLKGSVFTYLHVDM